MTRTGLGHVGFFGVLWEFFVFGVFVFLSQMRRFFQTDGRVRQNHDSDVSRTTVLARSFSVNTYALCFSPSGVSI
jgi:hypothetical protein